MGLFKLFKSLGGRDKVKGTSDYDMFMDRIKDYANTHLRTIIKKAYDLQFTKGKYGLLYEMDGILWKNLLYDNIYFYANKKDTNYDELVDLLNDYNKLIDEIKSKIIAVDITPLKALVEIGMYMENYLGFDEMLGLKNLGIYDQVIYTIENIEPLRMEAKMN